jgi:hypothetical protein
MAARHWSGVAIVLQSFVISPNPATTKITLRRSAACLEHNDHKGDVRSGGGIGGNDLNAPILKEEPPG